MSEVAFYGALCLLVTASAVWLLYEFSANRRAEGEAALWTFPSRPPIPRWLRRDVVERHARFRAPPECDLDHERRAIDALLECIASGVVHSAHDCSDGGLAVALALSLAPMLST